MTLVVHASFTQQGHQTTTRPRRRSVQGIPPESVSNTYIICYQYSLQIITVQHLLYVTGIFSNLVSPFGVSLLDARLKRAVFPLSPASKHTPEMYQPLPMMLDRSCLRS
jgi:hypothetical protein